MKRKILYGLGLGICLVSIFFGWKIYQNSTRTIVSIDDMLEIRLEKKDNKLNLSGKIDMGAFERISNWGAVQKEGVIYVYIMKTKAIIQSKNLDIDLNDVIISDSNEKPSKVYLVSGSEIEVKFDDDPRKDYIDVMNYDDKTLIFTF
ncbi:MAG TPA: hypothetical protein DEQ24_00010 [Enterococcus sp.]|nr:hypothetical protein [Enterococcus sp.]